MRGLAPLILFCGLAVLAAWQLVGLGQPARELELVEATAQGRSAAVRRELANKDAKHSRFGARMPGSEYGKAIFDRLLAASKVAGTKHKQHITHKLAVMRGKFDFLLPNTTVTNAANFTEDEEPTEEEGQKDMDEEEMPPNTIYVYDGNEAKSQFTELITYILAAGFALPDIRYIKSPSDADIRSATWDEDCRAIIFPPLHSIPDFAPAAVQDLKNFVSRGQNESGTILFLGSSIQVHVMNELFGFQLQQDYKEGPYYRNERGTMGTILAKLPQRVNELGNTQSLGLLKASMPPETSDYYSSFGDSVASCVRWDLGRVCYLAQDFEPLQGLPELQERVGSADPYVARKAHWELAKLSRQTDTWLAIFQAMLEQPYHATY